METVKLEAIDGGAVRAFVARPQGEPKGCVVVAQEIFGVNDHVRWVLAEQYARAGYLAVAPAFFDRLEADAEFGYTPETTARGRALVDALGLDAPLRDIRAAQQQVGAGLPTGVVGYCWGGTVAYLAATRLGLPAVGYYGGRSAPFLHERVQAAGGDEFSGEADHQGLAAERVDVRGHRPQPRDELRRIRVIGHRPIIIAR